MKRLRFGGPTGRSCLLDSPFDAADGFVGSRSVPRREAHRFLEDSASEPLPCRTYNYTQQ